MVLKNETPSLDPTVPTFKAIRHGNIHMQSQCKDRRQWVYYGALLASQSTKTSKIQAWVGGTMPKIIEQEMKKIHSFNLLSLYGYPTIVFQHA